MDSNNDSNNDSNGQVSCDPSEKTLYTEPNSDHWGTWDDRLFQTGYGDRRGIGIAVGGLVYVLPLKKWHELAMEAYPIPKLKE